MNTREFLDDMKDLLKKHSIKSIIPMYNSEDSHIKILDDGRLSVCGMKIDAIDMVEVVRCKDCKWLELLNSSGAYALCSRLNKDFTPVDYVDLRTHFCSLGERKGDR